MPCPGLHCACCAGGVAVPVVPLVEVCGAVWVIEHLVAVIIVCAVCGLLAVLASVLLLWWAQRRDDRRLAAWRAAHARPEPEPVRYVRAEVIGPEPVVAALPAPQVVINVFGTPDAGQAEVIRQALGTGGRGTTIGHSQGPVVPRDAIPNGNHSDTGRLSGLL